jgi:DNA-binding winged helix-turn-helix (wHTH) protein
MTRTPSHIGSSSAKCLRMSTAATRSPGPSSSIETRTGSVISQTATECVVRTNERGTTCLNGTAVARFGCITADFAGAEVYRDGVKVLLTAYELKVLRYFIDNPGRVISRHEFLEKVWGYNAFPTTRTVDNQILKLRKKLERNARTPSHFVTVHGIGYKFVREEFKSGTLARLESLQASMRRNAGWEDECDGADLRNIMLGHLSALYGFLTRHYPTGSMPPQRAQAFHNSFNRANGAERRQSAEERPHLVNPSRSQSL